MHESFMRLALEIAKKGMEKGQSPFGAVIVKNGEVLAKAHNTVLADGDSTAHAEMNAIRMASKKLGSWNLEGSVIYSTCEPCPMCLSAIHWARIDEVVFGASIQDAKRVGFNEIEIPAEEMLRISRGTLRVKITGGVLAEECRRLLLSWKGPSY